MCSETAQGQQRRSPLPTGIFKQPKNKRAVFKPRYLPAGTFMSLYGAEMARSCASAIASPLSSTAARRVLSPFTLFVTAAAATAEVRFTTRDAWVGTVVDAAATHADDKDGEKEDEAAKEGTADDVDGRLVEVGSACR